MTSRVPPEELYYKTELCRSFEAGKCSYRVACRFAHGAQELRPMLRPTNYKTKGCVNFARTGKCAYGSHCNFIHSLEALIEHYQPLLGAQPPARFDQEQFSNGSMFDDPNFSPAPRSAGPSRRPTPNMPVRSTHSAPTTLTDGANQGPRFPAPTADASLVQDFEQLGFEGDMSEASQEQALAIAAAVSRTVAAVRLELANPQGVACRPAQPADSLRIAAPLPAHPKAVESASSPVSRVMPQRRIGEPSLPAPQWASSNVAATAPHFPRHLPRNNAPGRTYYPEQPQSQFDLPESSARSSGYSSPNSNASSLQSPPSPYLNNFSGEEGSPSFLDADDFDVDPGNFYHHPSSPESDNYFVPVSHKEQSVDFALSRSILRNQYGQ